MTSLPPSIDADWIRRVAEDVVARLRASVPGPGHSGMTLNDTVIVADSVSALDPGTVVLVSPRSVITPAAKDVARERQIEIKRRPPNADSIGSSAAVTSPDAATSGSLVNRSGRNWSASIEHQLNLRGVTPSSSTIVLSTEPAKETYQQIQSGRRAVSISRWIDVARFQTELAPDTWVLDVAEMNLMEAVNLIARIHSLGNQA